MKKRYITLPETWDELTPDDWQGLLRIRHTMMTTDHAWTAGDARTETACMLLKNRGLKPRPDNRQYLVLVNLLSQSLDWLWKAEDGGLSLTYRSTYNLLPKVTVRTKGLHRELLGPLDHGNDLTFGEFRMAYAILRNYEQQPSERDLNVLAGLLYRPEASGQAKHEQQLRRQPYDWDDFEQKERRGQLMKRWQVWGIYAWFAYFCEYLTTGIFIIDGQNVTFAPLFGSGEAGGQAADGGRQGEGGSSLHRVALTLAGSHVFGTMKEVDRTPLLTVMLKMLMDYESLRDMKARMKVKH